MSNLKHRKENEMDKVQKIKDWICKEQDGLMNAQCNFEYPEHEGVYHILCNLYSRQKERIYYPSRKRESKEKES
jgi:hypothetical protein